MQWFLKLTTISVLLCLILTSVSQAQLANTKIAFRSIRDGNHNTEIYVMNADGTNQVNLTNNTAYDAGHSWSPDGTKIAFDSNRDGVTKIYVMNVDGTNQTRLINNTVSEQSPSWSPDGTKIAFQSGRDGNMEVYVMNADGTNQVNLTNNPAFDGGISWSPDGTKIAFESGRDDPQADIYVMNADGTNQTRLTNNTVTDGHSSWSPFLPMAHVSSTNLNIGIVNKVSSGTATFMVTNSGARTLSVSNITSSETPHRKRRGIHRHFS